MAGFDCPNHGPQIALHFCDHAGCAIDEGRVVPVFLQHLRWGWVTLCEECVRSEVRDPGSTDASYLVCGECAIEWAEMAGNNYVKRSQDPRPEFPK